MAARTRRAGEQDGVELPSQKEQLLNPQRPTPPRYRPRYVPERPPSPPKTTIAATLMLLFGTVFIATGARLWFHEGTERAYGLMMIGAIRQGVLCAKIEYPLSPVLLVIRLKVLLPGSYASYNLLGAYLGWDGFDYRDIPSYDDD